jgi:hypothetical protein
MSPPAVPTPQEPRRGEHHRVDPDDDEQMTEINMIFGGSMSITSKTQGRRMMWSDVGILFGPEYHLDTELSERNLSFMVKIPIEWHKVAKTLIDSGASLNLMMRKTFIEMGLNLAELTPMHDTFYEIILGQSSTPNGHIDLEVSCGLGENKHREILTFEVASFNIGYNYILCDVDINTSDTSTPTHNHIFV